MASDKEYPEDQGQDKVKEKEPFDRELQQDVQQDGQGPKEDAGCGTVPREMKRKRQKRDTRAVRRLKGKSRRSD